MTVSTVKLCRRRTVSLECEREQDDSLRNKKNLSYKIIFFFYFFGQMEWTETECCGGVRRRRGVQSYLFHVWLFFVFVSGCWWILSFCCFEVVECGEEGMTPYS